MATAGWVFLAVATGLWVLVLGQFLVWLGLRAWTRRSGRYPAENAPFRAGILVLSTALNVGMLVLFGYTLAESPNDVISLLAIFVALLCVEGIAVSSFDETFAYPMAELAAATVYCWIEWRLGRMVRRATRGRRREPAYQQLRGRYRELVRERRRRPLDDFGRSTNIQAVITGLRQLPLPAATQGRLSKVERWLSGASNEWSGAVRPYKGPFSPH